MVTMRGGMVRRKSGEDVTLWLRCGYRGIRLDENEISECTENREFSIRLRQ